MDCDVNVVCIPQRGGTKTLERQAYEKSAKFKARPAFRAGIEGRISALFRGRGMKRCLAEGRERFELWVTTVVLAPESNRYCIKVCGNVSLQAKGQLFTPVVFTLQL